MNCYNCGSKRLVCDKEADRYVCLDCNYVYPKQYFFISHSHEDIEKVRIIRNTIEETFFYEPILFFLKCLSNEQELNQLIKREIYERIWFIYCKSEKAEKSKYVQFERNYIKELIDGGKKINIIEIDIDKYEIWDSACADYIREQIAYKIKKTSVFLSYTPDTYKQAYAIREELVNNNFCCFFDLNNLAINGSWFESVSSQIKKTAYKNSALLAIFSLASLDSVFFTEEINGAIFNNGLIVPVLYAKKEEEFDALLEGISTRFPQINLTKAFFITDENFESANKQICEYLLNY